jgi:exonuclease III
MLGWRLDYFLASEELMERVVKSDIAEMNPASDHVPIYIEFQI